MRRRVKLVSLESCGEIRSFFFDSAAVDGQLSHISIQLQPRRMPPLNLQIRISLITDANRRRVADNKGGLNSYRVIKDEMRKINAQRTKKGQPPRVLRSQYIYASSSELGLEWETKRPGGNTVNSVGSTKVLNYFRTLVDELYDKNEKPMPSVNAVRFLAGDEELRNDSKDRLDEYVRFFRGKNRVIRGLDEIQSAHSSKETRN
jgi:hypothetical protein